MPPRNRAQQSGFTLVEAIAAFAVASVVLIGVGALVHNMALSFDRGTGAVNQSERMLLVFERLAEDFASVRFVQRITEAGPVAIFTATPPAQDSPGKLVFVSAGSVPQGDEVITLTIEETDDVTRLIRQRAPWPGPASRIEDLIPQDTVVLLEGRFDAAFAFGRIMPDATLRWSDSWSSEFGLPRMVRISLRDRQTGSDLGGDVEFPLRADAPANCAQPEIGATCLAPGNKRKASPDAEIQKTRRANE
jgi:hypothetical protein